MDEFWGKYDFPTLNVQANIPKMSGTESDNKIKETNALNVEKSIGNINDKQNAFSVQSSYQTDLQKTYNSTELYDKTGMVKLNLDSIDWDNDFPTFN